MTAAIATLEGLQTLTVEEYQLLTDSLSPNEVVK